MKLLTLHFSNFKGIAQLDVDLGGNDILVFGDNGTGKTTFADGFFWLLFGKDSFGRANFEIKTFEPNGDQKHRIEHTVKGVFDLGGGLTLELERTFKEVWSAIRGSANKDQMKHTTLYKVNGVVTDEKGYNKMVAEVCPEARFRLLTDPSYFNDQVNWKDRRIMLLSVFGDITDAEVIASNPALKDLEKLLVDGRTVEMQLAISSAHRKKAEEEIKNIPHRIDELQKQLGRESETPTDLTAIDKRLEELQAEKLQIENGGRAADLTKRLAEIESEKLVIRNRLAGGANEEYEAALAEVRTQTQLLAEIEGQIDAAKSLARRALDKRMSIDADRDQLRIEYSQVSGQKFAWHGTDICTSCGQMLPSTKLATARETAEAAFNLDKSQKLEAMNAQGMALRELSESLRIEAEEQEARVSSLETARSESKAKLDQLQALADSKKTAPPDPFSDPAFIALESEKIEIGKKLAAIENDLQASLDELFVRMDAIRAERINAISRNGLIETSRRAADRISELEAEHEKRISEHEDHTRTLHLLEEFTRTKVRKLTDRINEKFETVRFRLFKNQVNGGIEECCDATVNGVPYGALNHGSRMNAGLEIIDVLAAHFEFAPPIVIDNAESVTAIRQTMGQQIRLVVSAKDKSLRFVPAGLLGALL